MRTRRIPNPAHVICIGSALAVAIALPCAFATAQAEAKTVKKSITMTMGKTKTVSMKLPKKVKKAKWTTTAKSIVTVKAQGKNKAKLTAKNTGTCTVTGKAGKNKYQWSVTVRIPSTPANPTTPTTPDTPTTPTTPDTPSTPTTPDTPSTPDTPTTPTTPDTPTTPTTSDTGKTMQMPTISITTATRQAYYDKNGEPTARTDATPTSKTVRIATITFPELPTNLAELKQYESLLKDQQNGKFYFYGLYAATVKTFDGTLSRQITGANQTTRDMLEYLATCPYNATYTGYADKYVAERDWQNFFNYMKRTYNGKMECEYMGDVFWDNVSYTNGYKASAPYTITVEEDPYGEFAATATTPAFERIICRGAGDNFSQPQYLRVTWSGATGRWALFSNNWLMLASSSEIKAPAMSW